MIFHFKRNLLKENLKFRMFNITNIEINFKKVIAKVTTVAK